jgi:hypothetical protein
MSPLGTLSPFTALKKQYRALQHSNGIYNAFLSYKNTLKAYTDTRAGHIALIN